MWEDWAAGRDLRLELERPSRPMPTGSEVELLETNADWKAARKLARRGFASDTLDGIVETNIKRKGEMVEGINFNGIVTRLEQMKALAKTNRRSELFVGSWEPGELDGMIEVFKAAEKGTAAIGAKAGAQTGSAQRALQMSVGGLLGGTAGMLSAPILADLMSDLVQTSGGRAFVRMAFGSSPSLDHPVFATVAAFLRAQTASPGKIIRGGGE